MAPGVFEILLRYIYTGQLSYNACKNVGWVSLLDGANKLELLDLLAVIETSLIDNQEDWIQQNILTVHKYAASTVCLNKLLAYCNRIMASHPDIIFKSDDLAILPKETLITLLKNDKLNMDEDDIWVSVIQWAIKQVPELELVNVKEPDNWSPNDINTIKDIIADCIHHIRFVSISPKTVVLYNDLLPSKMRRDILNYYIDKDYASSTDMLSPRIRIEYLDSLIINKQQAQWISSKIVESRRRIQGLSVKQDDVYKFTLLYRSSRDDNTAAKFRELCNDKGPTIAVGKVLGTEEILGGYNPFSWGSQFEYADTKESFIFALDKSTGKSKVSFVGNNSKCAIYDWDCYFPVFGSGFDLSFGVDGEPFAYNDTYQVSIRNSDTSFEWADWEVFLISKF